MTTSTTLAPVTRGKAIDQELALKTLDKRSEVNKKIKSILEPPLNLIGDPSLKQFALSDTNAYVFDVATLIDMLQQTNANFLTIVLGAHIAASTDPDEGFSVGDQTVMLVPCKTDPTTPPDSGVLQALRFTDKNTRQPDMVAYEHPPKKTVATIQKRTKHELFFEFKSM